MVLIFKEKVVIILIYLFSEKNVCIFNKGASFYFLMEKKN
jgi:hypothetical protein